MMQAPPSEPDEPLSRVNFPWLKYIACIHRIDPMNESDGFIGIGTFSIITRLTRRVLRLYDEKGLLTPARREITGYRQYSYQQIRRGIQLKRLSDPGFSIREMREITDALDGERENNKAHISSTLANA